MKILFLCIYPPNKAPSQRFRFEQYLDVLSKNGFEITFSSALNEKEYKVFYSKGHLFSKALMVAKSAFKRFIETWNAAKYDVVFVQREGLMLGSSFFEKRFAKKTNIIFDYDDAIWITTVSPAYKALHFLKDPDKTKRIIEVSYSVFAGNSFLANYAKKYNDNVLLVPTTIDTKSYQPDYKKNKSALCIGWSGSFSTIVNLEVCIEALGLIKDKYGDKVYFKIIGDANYVNEKLNVQGIPWIAETEVAELQEIDIGIMPLFDDIWSKGKCGLKGLQYMALAIPTIMSKVGANIDIIEEGENGYLAATTEEWVETISRLVDDADLRVKIGKEGRKTVEEKYSVEANEQLYVDCFMAAAKNKKR